MGIPPTIGESQQIVRNPIPRVFAHVPIRNIRSMLQSKKISKAVIPAAGLGTRMLPATKAVPKEMLPIAGKPLIQYAIEELAASGIDSVILVVRNQKSLLQSHFERDLVLESSLESRHLAATVEELRRLNDIANLQFVEQHQPLGLANAVCCARPLLAGESFFVLLPDVIMVNPDPVARQMIQAQASRGGSVVAIREIEAGEVDRHGIVEVDPTTAADSGATIRITGLVEKPSLSVAPSRFGVFGRYVLEPAIWEAIDQTNPDARGEIQLTDALNLLCRTNSLYGLHFQGHHYDAGDPFGYFRANVDLSLRDPHLRQPCLEYLSRLQTTDA
jgi:UTP--glucose-1-phosphate uridylyltransferase